MPVMLGVLPGSLIGSHQLMKRSSRLLRLVFSVVILSLAVEMIYSGLTRGWTQGRWGRHGPPHYATGRPGCDSFARSKEHKKKRLLEYLRQPLFLGARFPGLVGSCRFGTEARFRTDHLGIKHLALLLCGFAVVGNRRNVGDDEHAG